MLTIMLCYVTYQKILDGIFVLEILNKEPPTCEVLTNI